MKLNYFIFAILLLALSSCGDEHPFINDSTLPAEGRIKVKFVHAATDGLVVPRVNLASIIRNVDFYTGSVKVSGTSIAYGSAFPVTGYAALESYTDLTIKAPAAAATTTTPELTELNLITSQINIVAGKTYTAIVIGPSDAREVLVLEDNLDQTPMDGRAYIRFVNLVPNGANNYSLVGTPPNPATGPASTPITLAENFAYKQSSPNFVPITAGQYTSVQVKDAVAGTVVVSLSAASSSFLPNKVYTVIVRGKAGLTSTDPERILADRIINR